MSEDTFPADWQTHHLFVLVGANPLPSFVAGKLLLPQRGKLHLVHSPDTSETAKRVASLFPSYVRHEVKNAADPQDIQAVLEEALIGCTAQSVGLNYTGGTKAMAVHAHRTVSTWAEKRGKHVVLSYLDAHTLSMRRDDRATGIPVQMAMQPTIEHMLELHGIKLDEDWPAEHEARFGPLNVALARAHQSREGQAAYNSWCQRYLRRPKKAVEDACLGILDTALQSWLESPNQIQRTELFRTLLASWREASCCEAELVDKRNQFTKLPIPFPSDPSLCEVVDAMRQTFDINGTAFDPGEVSANKALGFREIKDVVKYLDGDWLEHLTLAAFVANRKQCQVHDWAMSLKTTKEPYDFEFDVAAMRGYQLYAISCTRSADRRLCKSKLFETYTRTAQLGGDEARAGLVCCDRDPKVLQRQVSEQWRAESERLRVFGPQDLTELPARFSDWLSS